MASWELSPLYRHSTSSLLPSSSQPLLLSSHHSKLILRSSTTLQIVRTWSLLSSSQSSTSKDSSLSFSISPTNLRILVSTSDRGTAWVLDPDKDEPVAKLNIGGEESEGFESSWDGNSILSWSAHRLRISIFSLDDPGLIKYIQNPKCTFREGGYDFNDKHGHFVVLERHGNRDCLGIYESKNWSLLRNVVIQDPASDLGGVKWSPDGKYFVAWSNITHYYLHVFTLDGRKISTYSPYSSLSSSLSTPFSPTNPSSSSTEQSRLKKSLSSYIGLGIRVVEWNESGEFLAIGGYDGKVRVLSRAVGFENVVSELSCPNKVIGGKKERTVVWREPNKGWIENTLGKGIVPFDSIPTPHNLNQTPQPIDQSKPNPRIGISRIVWSVDSKWLCVLNQSFPSNLYIFSFLTSTSPNSSASVNEPSYTLHLKPKLHTLILLNSSIKTFSFQPPSNSSHSSSILTILTGEQSFILWTSPLPCNTEEGNVGLTEGVGIPGTSPEKVGDGGGFKPNAVSFGVGDGEGEGREGRVMLLSEKGGMFCCGYPVD